LNESCASVGNESPNRKTEKIKHLESARKVFKTSQMRVSLRRVGHSFICKDWRQLDAAYYQI
jgi:hypothetical protein